MKLSRLFPGVVLLFLLEPAVLLPVRSAPPAATLAGPTDRLGDPLPESALARLGTLRWRRYEAEPCLSPDGRWVALVGEHTDLRVWEVPSGKPLPWVKPDPAMRAAAFTPNSKVLLIATVHRGTDKRGRPTDDLSRWAIQHREVGTGRLLREVTLAPVEYMRGRGYWFSRNGEFFLGVMRRGDKAVAVWHTDTGKLHFAGAAGPLDLFSVFTALSDDGKTLAVAAEDGRLHLYELPAGKHLYNFPLVSDGGKDGKVPLAFSPDGRTLISSGEYSPSVRKSLFIWEVATGELRHRIKDGSRAVRYSPDGRYLACRPYDRDAGGGIRLLDARTFEEVRRLAKDPALTYPLSFSGDGKLLMALHASTVGLWDVASGKHLNPTFGHCKPVTRVAFSPDGRLLVSGDEDGVALVWDLETGKPRQRLTGHHIAVASLAFSPDGKTLAVGDGTAYGARSGIEAFIHLWDLGRGERLRRFGAHLNGVCSLAFSPDGKALASAGYDDHFRVWDPATGERRFQVQRLRSQYSRVAYSPNGKQILNMASASRPSLHRPDNGEKVRDLGVAGPRHRDIYFAAFLPDGQTVLTLEEGEPAAEKEYKLCSWDARTGKLLRAVKGPPPPPDLVQGIALSPDASTLAVAFDKDNDSAIQLWDPGAGEVLATLDGHDQGVTALAFSPDGKRLASGSWDTTVLVWDVPGAILWEELGEGDKAGRGKRRDPEDTVAFLKRRLLQAARAEVRVRQLLGELDAGDFEVRERATRALEWLDPGARFALRWAPTGRPSLEARNRLKGVLKKLPEGKPGSPSYEVRRLRRAMKLLAGIDSAKSRRALEELASGDAGLTVTRLAREALRDNKDD